MIRKAKVPDVKKIQELINFYAEDKEMLPRSLNELYENIQDFFVEEKNGEVVACGALHIIWEDLAEIKSLAVEKNYRGQGLGKKLVQEFFKQAKKLVVKKIFVLTFKPEYFKQFGFKEIPREKLPHKIWGECIRCHLFPDCKEVAMLVKI